MQRDKNIERAATCIKQGGIIAYPTEGVFGLGCDPDNEVALKRLINLKQRSNNKGLIIIAACRAQLDPYIAPVDESLEKQLQATWPGPTTWILAASPGSASAGSANAGASALLTGNRNTIATRVTLHETAAKLCLTCGHAIVSTSANLSGQASCKDAQSVADCFGDTIDYLLDMPVGNLENPTPIFDGATGKQLR